MDDPCFSFSPPTPHQREPPRRFHFLFEVANLAVVLAFLVGEGLVESFARSFGTMVVVSPEFDVDHGDDEGTHAMESGVSCLCRQEEKRERLAGALVPTRVRPAAGYRSVKRGSPCFAHAMRERQWENAPCPVSGQAGKTRGRGAGEAQTWDYASTELHPCPLLVGR